MISLSPTLALVFINDQDLTVEKISEKCIHIESAELLKQPFTDFRIALFNLKSYQYDEFVINDWVIDEIIEELYSYTYIIRYPVFCDDLSSRLERLEDFTNYLHRTGKVNQIDTFAKIRHLYPVEKDQDFCSSYEEQITQWMDFELNDPIRYHFTKLSESFELAFSLHSPDMYLEFLQLTPEELFQKHLEKYHLTTHPLFESNVKRLYIGNEFCPSLFPSLQLLKELLEKAQANKFKITIAYPYLLEENILSLGKTLTLCNSFAEKNGIRIELIVNDWGVLQGINQQLRNIEPILGRLLNKRMKDPRFKWKWKPADVDELFHYNNLNLPLMSSFLKKRNVNRFEYEAFPLRNVLAGEGHSLHFPFYQMMTSLYCFFFYKSSKYKFMKLNKIEACPGLCQHVGQLYPSHLKVLGKGNTVFGFFQDLFTQPTLLEDYIQQGIDRFVFTAL